MIDENDLPDDLSDETDPEFGSQPASGGDDAPEAAEAMLTPAEARVLGCLMEKQRTTPDQYPLTLNALVTACNQKTSRHPVMKLTPGDVGHTVNVLRDRGLIYASFSGRTERYDHKMVGTFMLDRREQALLCTLMLRGPQTPGELRVNTGRMADFPDLSDVLSTLDAMAHRNPPLVRELPRQAGMREQRFAHLLCGEPKVEQAAPAVSSRSADHDRLARLEAEVAALRAEVEDLKRQLT